MRDIREVIDSFHLLYDQYSRQEGLLDSEVCVHLNGALASLMADCFYRKELKRSINASPPYGYESDQFVVQDFSPLLSEVELIPDANGMLAYLQIRSEVGSEVGQITVRDLSGQVIQVRDPEIFHYDFVSRYNPDTDDFTECRWVRGNDILRDARNPYREPIDGFPKYRLTLAGLKFYPSTDAAVRLSIVREHPWMWYDQNDLLSKVDFELNVRVQDAMINRALIRAGISVRDMALFQTAKSNEQ